MSRGLVLVTGAAKRIGAAIARKLAADGWRVGVHYRASREAAEALASEIGGMALEADLNDPAALDALGRRLAEEDWRGLVNNASVFAYDALADFGFEAALAALRANLVAPIYLAKLLHARGGDDRFVVNVADQKVWNPNPDFLSYTLSKIALAHATDTLAAALAPVRVNCVAPGLTLLSGDQSEDNFARVHARTPLTRGTSPQDLADAIAYLAGATAVTGATLLVDAGQHLVKSARDVMFD